MPAHPTLRDTLDAALPAWQRAGHRLAVLISGTPDWVMTQAQSLVDDDSLWIGPDAPTDTTSLGFRRAGEALGGESGRLFVNALTGFDPDALGAAAGRVRGGGCLVLLTPPLGHWPSLTDADMARLVPYPFQAGDAGPAYRERLVRILGIAPRLWHLAEGQPVAPPPSPEPVQGRGADASPSLPSRTVDQSQAIEAILAVARGRPRRPLVLRSHRGRGKTSALGLAAAQVLEQGLGDVLVTAPRREAVAPLFDRLRERADTAADNDGAVRLGSQRLRFLPPDVLLEQRPEARLLLVDEAAALPTAVLEALFDAFPRCVFATTEHGYEGSGRGFTLRFLPRLEASAVSVRHHWLTTPIRWSPDDPLEQLVDRLLLLDADPTETLPVDTRQTPRPAARLEPSALAGDERRLREWFGLLVAAHYRTTPRDLRQLLDGPASQLWSIETGAATDRAVIATAATQDEGGLPDDLAAAVFDGERRLRGHLLPQTLAAHAGWPDWPRLTGRRIQRIAVHPAARRQGAGGELVAAIAATARDEGRDFVGASFGGDDELVAFWAAAGMRVLHLGQHRDHASGSEAVVMAMGLSPAGKAAVERAAAGFVDRLPTRAAGPLRHVEPERLATLLAVTPPRPVPALTLDQHRQLIACARHRHHLDAALDTLRAWLTPALTQPAAQRALEPERRALLIGRMLQLRDETTLAQRFGLAGRRAVEATCREALARLLDALTDQR
ncbi:GNAT family N-acetyltransferase [Guyparkeria hydrothermalis]|uniref:tRNA(Met) cytidine acetyltransferase TmcA n=1 Tax=Guyparkeria hydrothermalis TaxID=923 RepID=UPI002021F423|nr:GNAT family N-acetyltransferase [Guyparkeria hydrothermalis]MCL7750356.1 GNAT family N-acetyltransferase [Guyparkeria hydrothermalis]